MCLSSNQFGSRDPQQDIGAGWFDISDGTPAGTFVTPGSALATCTRYSWYTGMRLALIKRRLIESRFFDEFAQGVSSRQTKSSFSLCRSHSGFGFITAKSLLCVAVPLVAVYHYS